MSPGVHNSVAHLALGLGLLLGAALLAPTAMAQQAAPAGSLITITAPPPPATDNEPVERPVSYAPEQAERGKKKFLSDCAECHGETLNGGLNGGPPLRGIEFDETFADGLPASSLFLFMSTQMPPDSPGRFSPDTYADLMAYVLRVNGYQPGAALPADGDALDYLIMEK